LFFNIGVVFDNLVKTEDLVNSIAAVKRHSDMSTPDGAETSAPAVASTIDVRRYLDSGSSATESSIFSGWLDFCGGIEVPTDIGSSKQKEGARVTPYIEALLQSNQWKTEVDTMWQTMNCGILNEVLSYY
jgi:hypothetical protein